MVKGGREGGGGVGKKIHGLGDHATASAYIYKFTVCMLQYFIAALN